MNYVSCTQEPDQSCTYEADGIDSSTACMAVATAERGQVRPSALRLTECISREPRPATPWEKLVSRRARREVVGGALPRHRFMRHAESLFMTEDHKADLKQLECLREDVGLRALVE
jgi:hypothetical protein